MENKTRLNRTRVRQLIKFIKNKVFNWGNPETCLGSYAMQLCDSLGISYRSVQSPYCLQVKALMVYFNLEEDQALHLYQGRDLNGEKLWSISFSDGRYPSNLESKNAALKYLRRFA